MKDDSSLIGRDDRILITGAAGFIGSRVVKVLLERGFRNLVCLARPSGRLERLEAIRKNRPEGANVEVFQGNLLSREDCAAVTKDVALILHLAAGAGEKSFPDAILNTVVTTRNLLDASLQHARLKRFVLVSSLAVYSNRRHANGNLLDESSPVDDQPALRGEAYSYAKVKQEQLLAEYGRNFGVPYVIVRPGSVFGEGKKEITGRVGIGTFGIFLHLGGSNSLPLTYVENCADAIALSGVVKGIEGEAFNIVDDDVPTSRQFLRQYKRNVRKFRSIFVPRPASHALCYLWEKYSDWSEGQLPQAFNRLRWHAYWKKTRYTNQKLKARLGWTPRVPMSEGLRRYFESCRENGKRA